MSNVCWCGTENVGEDKDTFVRLFKETACALLSLDESSFRIDGTGNVVCLDTFGGRVACHAVNMHGTGL